MHCRAASAAWRKGKNDHHLRHRALPEQRRPVPPRRRRVVPQLRETRQPPRHGRLRPGRLPLCRLGPRRALRRRHRRVQRLGRERQPPLLHRHRRRLAGLRSRRRRRSALQVRHRDRRGRAPLQGRPLRVLLGAASGNCLPHGGPRRLQVGRRRLDARPLQAQHVQEPAQHL